MGNTCCSEQVKEDNTEVKLNHDYFISNNIDLLNYNTTKSIEINKPDINNFELLNQFIEIHKHNDIKPMNLEPIEDLPFLGPYFDKTNNTIYEGQFNKGVKEGLGHMKLLNINAYYEGYFKDDKFNGKGRIILDNNKVLIGNFEDNKLNGEGTYEDLENNIKYTGSFRNSKKDGIGKEVYNKNETEYYEGEFKNDLKEGHGKFVWSDNKIYQGDFKSNNIEGKGILTLSNNEKYEGEFKESAAYGAGKYYYSDGTIYEGLFKNNKKHGKGKLIFNDGDYIIGQFEEGFLNKKETHKLFSKHNKEIKDITIE